MENFSTILQTVWRPAQKKSWGFASTPVPPARAREYDKVLFGRLFQSSTTERVVESYNRFVTSTIRLAKKVVNFTRQRVCGFALNLYACKVDKRLLKRVYSAGSRFTDSSFIRQTWLTKRAAALLKAPIVKTKLVFKIFVF